MHRLAPLLVLSLLAGCTSGGTDGTRYPSASPIYGARVSANPEARGSEAFCRTYARQTAGNQYEGSRDSGEGFSSNAAARRQAELAGERAYRRCLSGRRN
ncbi:hypothetical protein Sa4125_46780 [Aureimonas sp. SA4125]|uniref:hypothetical protein n=1 Tax=Aureimonas sp. SA4125 TaxID=2826993 RepID=UPI001CC5BEE4|nr:hypothetical protein [Aureimonas sp. SA4125]BDA87136.1 hypothetical protein Sa4125_46780 [Aureimonas sp. SA4125]